MEKIEYDNFAKLHEHLKSEYLNFARFDNQTSFDKVNTDILINYDKGIIKEFVPELRLQRPVWADLPHQIDFNQITGSPDNTFDHPENQMLFLIHFLEFHSEVVITYVDDEGETLMRAFYSGNNTKQKDSLIKFFKIDKNLLECFSEYK
jgi:hypothetical protein